MMSKNRLNSSVNFFRCIPLVRVVDCSFQARALAHTHTHRKLKKHQQKKNLVLCPLDLSLALGTLGLWVSGQCE